MAVVLYVYLLDPGSRQDDSAYAVSVLPHIIYTVIRSILHLGSIRQPPTADFHFDDYLWTWLALHLIPPICSEHPIYIAVVYIVNVIAMLHGETLGVVAGMGAGQRRYTDSVAGWAISRITDEWSDAPKVFFVVDRRVSPTCQPNHTRTLINPTWHYSYPFHSLCFCMLFSKN